MQLSEATLEEIRLAEIFAYDYFYPDSAAKGMLDKDGEYCDEIRIVMEAYISGMRNELIKKHPNKWLTEILNKKLK